MWSEGGWTGPDYSVAYAIADSPLGPFKRIGKILQQDMQIANGAGHHAVIQIPGKDEWYIVYHRLSPTQLQLKDKAWVFELTVESFLRATIGHEMHHINIIKKRYLPAL